MQQKCCVQMEFNGWHPKHSNDTLNYVYNVYFIHLTSLTSHNRLQITDMT
jgi:hypothetical protein